MIPPAWRSNPADVELAPDGGWVEWRGMTVTRLPLWDAKRGVFARLTYRDAAALAASQGARLGTTAEFDEMHRAAPFEPTPCIARLTADDQAAAREQGIEDPLIAFSRWMVTLDWAQRHDLCLTQKLAKGGWDGQHPVSNAGKQWIGGAAAGRALNYGWYDPKAPNGRMWQGRGTKHDDGHHDYSQLTMLFKGGVPSGGGGGAGGGGLPKIPPGPGPIIGGGPPGALAPLVRELVWPAGLAGLGGLLGGLIGGREGAAAGLAIGGVAGFVAGRDGTSGPA